MPAVPTVDQLAEIIYSAVPMKTKTSQRELTWKELKTLTGYPYPVIRDHHLREAKVLREYIKNRYHSEVKSKAKKQ